MNEDTLCCSLSEFVIFMLLISWWGDVSLIEFTRSGSFCTLFLFVRILVLRFGMYFTSGRRVVFTAEVGG